MHLAQQAWRQHRGLPHMREVLANWLPKGKSPDLRGWEWFYLNSLPYQNLRTLAESESGQFVDLMSQMGRARPCTVAWHIASKRLAEGTVDGLIRIWDVDREQTIMSVKGPAPVDWWDWGRWLGWSPDGAKLAGGGKDGTVHVWETVSGRELLVLRGHKSPIWSVAFSAGGTRVAAWGEDGTVKIWDADTGRLTAEVAHPGDVHAGAWSPDDKRLASGHGDGTVTVSSTRAGDKMVTLRGHVQGINRVVWGPDGTRLASASQDFTARIWNVDLGKMVLGPLRHSHVITSLAWEPDGQRLATGSADETVKIWNATTGSEAVTLRGHFQTVISLSWGPDGRLASGCLGGSLRIWNSIRDQESSVLPGRDVGVRSVSWSPDGTRLASGSDDGTVRVWDPVTREEVLTRKGHEERWVNQDEMLGLQCRLAWSPDGRHLASVGLDGTAKVWEIASGREVFAFPADQGMICSVGWSPDGTHLAVGALDGTIRVVEGLKQTPKVHLFKANPGGLVRCVAWSPQGDRLASGGKGDALVKVWDPLRGVEVARMRGHQYPWVLGVAWSPDGKRLASAAGDRSVMVWDAETGQNIWTMRGHTAYVDAVVWSPDGTRLASAGYDNSVRIWDPRTGEEALVLRGDSARFLDVSWHPDGAQLAAASDDGQIWIWDATRGFERDTTPRALPYIDRKVASGTARGEDLLWYAESYLRAGKPTQALAALKDDPYRLRKFARLLAEQGQAPLAADVARTQAHLLERQLAAKPDDLTSAYEIADLLLLDRPPTGAAAWTAAMNLVDPWAKLAAAYHVIGDQQALDELLEHRPEAAAGVGDLYAALGDWERAIAEYRKRLTDQRADVAFLTKLATACQSGGRTREAVPYLAKTSAADPSDTLLFVRVAALQAWFGQEKELADTCRRGLQLAENTTVPETADRVAKACCLLPSTEKARLEAVLALARQAVRLGKDSLYLPWFQMALGMAEFRSGHFEEADAALIAAAKGVTDNPYVTGTSAFYRAMSLFRQGQEDGARKLATAAAATIKPLPKDANNPLAGDASFDDLIMWLAYKEAKAMIPFDATRAAPAQPRTK